ncbi:MAG: hypothetical protein J7647_17805 [Cyanobacteria bacterium SBLK]|nr:hypothetical protein [Cyanobacteria bacterium SBLK]
MTSTDRFSNSQRNFFDRVNVREFEVLSDAFTRIFSLFSNKQIFEESLDLVMRSPIRAGYNSLHGAIGV